MLIALVCLVAAVAAQSFVAYGEEDTDPADHNADPVSSVESSDSTDSTTTDSTTTTTDSTTSTDTTSTGTDKTSTDSTSTDTTSTDSTSTDTTSADSTSTDTTSADSTTSTDIASTSTDATSTADATSTDSTSTDSTSTDTDTTSTDATSTDSITISAVQGGTVGLGTADAFAVLAGTPHVSNTGPTVVCGSVGIHPGAAVNGFTGPPNGTVICGTIHAADAVALQAQQDLIAAYNDAASRTCDPANNLTGTNLGGLTLVSNVYCFAADAFLTGTLTLDAQGDSNAVFIFQIGSALTTASNSVVNLINGAQACNVFWQVGSSATLGTTTRFVGNILALTSITANTGATVLDGRLLARNGQVDLDTNVITRATCAVAGGGGGGGGTGGTPGGTTGDTTGGGGGGKDGKDGKGGKGKGGSGTGADDSLTGSGTGLGDGAAGAAGGAAVTSKAGSGQGNLAFTGVNFLLPTLVGMLALLLGVLLRRHTRPAPAPSAAATSSSPPWVPRGASIRPRPPQ